MLDGSLKLFFRSCRVQSSRHCVEGVCWSIPAQLVHVIEEYDVGSKRGQCAKKHRAVSLPLKSVCEGKWVDDVHAPLAVVQRNGFKMEKFCKHSGRRFRSPARQTRVAIGGIAHQSQIVRDRRRRYAELLDYTGLVYSDACPAVQLYNARPAHTLS